jgi:hypothetical protein
MEPEWNIADDQHDAFLLGLIEVEKDKVNNG